MVARSVEVDFDANVAGFVAGLAEVDAALGQVDHKLSDLDGNDSIAKLGEEAIGAGAGLDGLGRESDKTREKVREHTREVDKFAEKLAQARAQVNVLADSFRQTGDPEILKQWQRATREVSTLERFAKTLKDDAADTTPHVKTLADELARGRSEVARLAAEFKRTGDVDILKSWRRASNDLKGLQRTADDVFGNVGKSLEKDTVSGLDKALQSLADALPGNLSPAVAGALVAGAVAALPLIGAALDAAVLAGVGGAALGAGLMLAVRNPQVKAAGSQLGQYLLAGLDQAAAPMTEAVLHSIGILRTGFDSLQPSIARIFANISPEVDKLAMGIVGLLQRAMPGIEEAVNAAKPLIDELAADMPRIGSALSDFLSMVAKGGPGATAFIHDFVTVLDSSLRTLGGFILAMSSAYEKGASLARGLRDLTSIMTGGLIPGLNGASGAGQAAGTAMAGFAGALVKTVPEALGLHQALGALTADFESLSDTGIQVTEAAIGWRAALANVNAAVKANGTDLRLSTEAGRANQQMIVDSVQAARRSYDANIKNHMSINAATSAYQSQIAALRNHLVQLGFNRAAVDRLIRTLAAVPPTVKTKAEVATAAAHNAIRTLQGAINSIHGKSIRIDAATKGAQNALDAIRGAIAGIHGKTVSINVVGSHTNLPQRWGGIVAAERGLLNAGIYTRPMVSFAEPATGGEAYVPRLGDYRRSTAILDQAAQWYGGRFMPGGGGGSRTVVVQLTNHGVIGNRIELENWLAKSVSNLARQGRI